MNAYLFGMGIGSNWMFILLAIVAIARAKNGRPWFWYGVGVAASVVPIAGNVISNRQIHGALTPSTRAEILAFAVLAIPAAMLIAFRRSR